MELGSGTSFQAVLTAPPGYELYLSELLLTAAVDSNKDSIIFLEVWVSTGLSGFRKLARFITTTAQPTIDLHQSGLPNIAINPLFPTDAMVVVTREGSGSSGQDNIRTDIMITAQLVTDA